MKEKNLTKDYLEENGWEFKGIFGHNLEIWRKESYIILVDQKTRERKNMFNAENESRENGQPKRD